MYKTTNFVNYNLNVHNFKPLFKTGYWVKTLDI